MSETHPTRKKPISCAQQPRGEEMPGGRRAVFKWMNELGSKVYDGELARMGSN